MDVSSCILQPDQGHIVQPTCTANRKKFRLNVPVRTTLFVTVMRMLLPQYARMETMGLFAIAGPDGEAMAAGLGTASNCPFGCLSPSSIVCSSRFLSSAWAIEEEKGSRSSAEAGGGGAGEVRGEVLADAPAQGLRPSELLTPMKVVILDECLRGCAGEGETWWARRLNWFYVKSTAVWDTNACARVDRQPCGSSGEAICRADPVAESVVTVFSTQYPSHQSHLLMKCLDYRTCNDKSITLDNIRIACGCQHPEVGEHHVHQILWL